MSLGYFEWPGLPNFESLTSRENFDNTLHFCFRIILKASSSKKYLDCQIISRYQNLTRLIVIFRIDDGPLNYLTSGTTN